MLLHFRVGLHLYVIPKLNIRESEGPEDYCLLSKVNTLNGRGPWLNLRVTIGSRLRP